MQFKPFIRTANYYETDQMGVIHHSNYIRWFEEARVNFMDQMGFPYKRLEDMGVISPVLGVECKYKAMVRFGDTVAITIKITEFNGIKYALIYEVTNTETGELCAAGSTQHCYLKKDGRPISIKKSVPELYEKFMEIVAE